MVSKKIEYRKRSSSLLAQSETSLSVLHCDVSTSKFDCITTDIENQAFSSDDSELRSKFTPKKKVSLQLSESYKRLGAYQKSMRVSQCGSFLEFAHEISEYGEVSSKGKLHTAYFCKDRLCPMCARRRSLKIFGQVSQIMSLIGSDYRFLFLSLTIPNVPFTELNSALNELLSAWNRYMGYSIIKTAVCGYFRALEITVNTETNTFHPHFHVIFAVRPSYFKKSYIKFDVWLDLWRKACRDYSIKDIYITVAKSKDGSNDYSSSVAEISKYAVKGDDFIFPDNLKLTDKIVSFLSSGLYHRRLCAFGGVFKTAFNSLGLEDAESENADLTHINEKLNPSLAWYIIRYGFNGIGYSFVDDRVEFPDQHDKK